MVKRVNWMISVVISYDNCTIKCQDYMTIVALNQNSIISAMNLEIRQNSTKEAKMSKLTRDVEQPWVTIIIIS